MSTGEAVNLFNDYLNKPNDAPATEQPAAESKAAETPAAASTETPAAASTETPAAVNITEKDSEMIGLIDAEIEIKPKVESPNSPTSPTEEPGVGESKTSATDELLNSVKVATLTHQHTPPSHDDADSVISETLQLLRG